MTKPLNMPRHPSGRIKQPVVTITLHPRDVDYLDALIRCDVLAINEVSRTSLLSKLTTARRRLAAIIKEREEYARG